MSTRSLVTVVGARPEFIKAAPLHRALRAGSGRIRFAESLVHTGQHYDDNMSAAFFTELGLPAPLHLGVGSASHGVQTGRMLAALDELLSERRPDLVMVFGDTNSTLSAALAAAKLHLPVVHVEAGLRSWNPAMPEEINRRLTDHLATLLLCPSPSAVENLAAEGIRSGVHLTGDVNLDAMLANLPSPEEEEATLAGHGVEPDRYALATVHRAENTDEAARLDTIFAAFGRLAAEGLTVLFPAHPRTRARLSESAVPPGVRVTAPVGHRDLLGLARRARVGLTDSGGIQKELYWLGTPCVTLREETEWIETLEDGRNVLVDIDVEAIVAASLAARSPADPPPPVYGEGRAASEMVAVLEEWAEGGA